MHPVLEGPEMDLHSCPAKRTVGSQVTLSCESGRLNCAPLEFLALEGQARAPQHLWPHWLLLSSRYGTCSQGF
jgi:hypothetical protein